MSLSSPFFLPRGENCGKMQKDQKKEGHPMKSNREYPALTVTEKGARWVEGGHPWIYAAEVLRTPEGLENGALADAVSEKGKYLGTGFFSRESKIRLRLVSRNANDRFDAAFWKRRLQYAWNYRKTVMGAQDLSYTLLLFFLLPTFLVFA